jgi:hypothetical protein
MRSAMTKVFDLRCKHDHRFEGWFGSDADWQSQREQGQVECPMCGDTAIERMPSAPRLNLGAAASSEPVQMAKPSAAQAAWLQAMRELVARTEDVGERFADEARRIHYGEVEQRGIRGRATRQQSAALREEGIEVMPLPSVLKQPLQ